MPADLNAPEDLPSPRPKVGVLTRKHGECFLKDTEIVNNKKEENNKNNESRSTTRTSKRSNEESYENYDQRQKDYENAYENYGHNYGRKFQDLTQNNFGRLRSDVTTHRLDIRSHADAHNYHEELSKQVAERKKREVFLKEQERKAENNWDNNLLGHFGLPGSGAPTDKVGRQFSNSTLIPSSDRSFPNSVSSLLNARHLNKTRQSFGFKNIFENKDGKHERIF